MKHALISALTLSAIIASVSAQDPALVQYVASVKKNVTGTGGQIRMQPGTVSVNGVPIRLLIRQAYGGLQDFQLVGGPSWVGSDRFDIEAKVEGGGPMSPQVLQSLLRQVLADRFALTVHNETRELPIYALVLARSDGRLGPNLKPTSDECAALMASREATDGSGRISSRPLKNARHSWPRAVAALRLAVRRRMDAVVSPSLAVDHRLGLHRTAAADPVAQAGPGRSTSTRLPSAVCAAAASDGCAAVVRRWRTSRA